MRMSTLIMCCNQTIQPPMININPSAAGAGAGVGVGVGVGVGGGRSSLNLQLLRVQQPPKEKLLVVMGATGTGKSRLSVDIATLFPAEIINSDKIQAYHGLDITTNKMTEEETKNVPHHLLGVFNPDQDFTAQNFRHLAFLTANSITGRGLLPVIAGGSNSYIEALLDENNREFHAMYECCFLWVDVSMRDLHSFVSHRVDRMVEKGMVDEVRNMFDLNNSDYSKGIRRAIGVPEFDSYFRTLNMNSDEETSHKLLQEAIEKVKINTCKLACRQLEKIKRLENKRGWKLHRIDATKVFKSRGKEAEEAWERHVARPSMSIVHQFLFDLNRPNNNMMSYQSVRQIKAMETAVAAAAR